MAEIPSSITFGTDGWRAIIGADFTPMNIKKVIQAFCDWRSRIDPQNKKIVLGYDRRNQSPESAEIVSQVLLGNGFEVRLSSQFCPTPCVSWMVKNSDAFAGIMVTASHNPHQWNGIKFKESYGGSASPEYTQEIEKQLRVNESQGRNIQEIKIEEGLKSGKLQYFNPHEDYVKHIRTLLDLNRIKKSGLKILADPLYGAGTGFLSSILEIPVSALHDEADITFGGLNPEPIEKNLSALIKNIPGNFDIGLATDGDADRIGAVDADGRYIDSHHIFALLLKHYVTNKKLKGVIVKSVSTSFMIDKLCAKYDLECIETPIGFKHICKHLVERNALMGGEESGGISFAPHVHERDGLLNGLMLVDMMACLGKSLAQLIEDLHEEIGPSFFTRYDAHVTAEIVSKLNASDFSSLKKINQHDVSKILTVDGTKFILKDGSWILIRASGTEPLVRIYSESSKQEIVDELIQFGKNLL